MLAYEEAVVLNVKLMRLYHTFSVFELLL